MREAFCIALAVVAVASLGCGPSTGIASTTDGGGSGGGSSGGGTGGGGSGGSGLACEQNAACGGDIVGTWAVTEYCSLPATVTGTGLCVQQQTTVSDPRATGTFTYRGDGTASLTLAISGTIKSVVPPACIETPVTCASLEAGLREEVNEPKSTYKSASCMSTATGNCECTVSFEAMTNGSVTYATSGSTLTHTAVGASATTVSLSYCVQGSMLVINTPNATGGPAALYVLTRER